MKKEEFKKYFNQEFQGIEDFIEKIVKPIGNPTDKIGTRLTHNYATDYVTECAAAHVQTVYDYGEYNVENTPVSVWEVVLADNCQISRARKQIQQVVRKLTENYTGAFIVFHYAEGSSNTDAKTWRFSWVKKEDTQANSTTAKRYTYLCGPAYSCRTIAERFEVLQNTKRKTLDSITAAFDVEALSEEFFKEYKVFYDDIIQWITGQRIIKGKDGKWKTDGPLGSGQGNDIYQEFKKEFNNDDEKATKAVRDYVKKLMGRLVFIQFLQKKNWLKINGNVTNNFLLEVFNKISPDSQNDFIETALEKVIYLLLNKETRKRVAEKLENLTLTVPFLNGGLFEPDKCDAIKVQLPKEFFHNEQYQDVKRTQNETSLREDAKFFTQCGLLDLFNQYNFTIDENDPKDAELGVDPEMLGKIFENLLEDNKDKGAFYTPKEIVEYMCKESLISYLQTGFDDETQKDAIRQFVCDDEAKLPDELKEGITEKLERVKICDPAIGSGAFPMGLLNLLVSLHEKMNGSLTAQERCNLKKKIICNNIYGVDIEMGAIDIARLRFWLSIMVDEENPTPLPNFDYKFMQGNSLLECYEGVDLNVMKTSDGSANFAATHITQLKNNLNAYFNCQNHKKKANLQTQIQLDVQDILTANGYITGKFSVINLAGNDQFFLWHTWFADVLDQGGFDIVIGNPPYIQLQNDGGKLGKMYQPCGYKTFASTGDIYCLFYERGHQLLKQNGHLCFITSNKWMRAGYGEKTREFFATKTNPILLIDFAGVKIFESATVDTNILLFAKAANQHKTVCAVTNKQNKDSVRNLSLFVQQNNTECDFTADSWVILPPIEQSIKRKIESVGTPLKDWDINIYRGVLTGCNEAFIISTDKRNEILNNCATEEERKRTEELIRPILRGRDIKRYGYDWAKLWLINTHNGVKGKYPPVDINDYPAVKQHLDLYWDKISKRDDKGITPYNLRNCAYLEDFLKPKIIYNDIAQHLTFALSSQGEYVNNTVYFITGLEKNEFLNLLKILNSSLIDWYYRTLSVQLGTCAVRLFSIYVLKLPIPKVNNQIKATSDNEINQQVYQLFGLDEREKNHLESL